MRRRKSPARGVYWSDAQQAYRADMQLRGFGRLAIGLDTTVAREAEDAAAAIRTVHHRGDFVALRRLCTRELSIGEFRAAVREGDYDRLQRMEAVTVTLGQARDWIISEVADNRPKSREKYVSITRAMVAHFGADTPLASISIDALLEWARAEKPKYHRPWSTAQRHQVHTVGKRMWRVAGRRAALAAAEAGVSTEPLRNPWQDIPRPRLQKTRVVYLSPEEWRAIATANAGRQRLALVAAMTFAGLRISEAGHLRLGMDVDMDERVIRVQGRAGRYPWRIKNDRARVIPMARELHDLFAAHVAAGYAPGLYLFRSRLRDAPLHLSELIRWVSATFGAAGIVYGRDRDKGMTGHVCRHTFATHLLLRGVPVHVAADLMGDTAKTVLDCYAHLLPLDRVAAIRQLDEVFG